MVSMTRLCWIIKMIILGSVIISAEAALAPVLAIPPPMVPMKNASVRNCSSYMYVVEVAASPHIPPKVKMITVAWAFFRSGSAIFVYNCHSEAPSIFPASKISFGT